MTISKVTHKLGFLAAVVVFIFCNPVAGRSDTPDERIDSLITAHESGFHALRSFDVEVETHSIKFPTNPTGIGDWTAWLKTAPDKELALNKKFHWVYDGARERIQVKPFQSSTNDKNLPMGILDVFRDGDNQFILGNWDWETPQPISPAKQGTVFAEINTQTSTYGQQDPAMYSLRLPRFEYTEPRVTLREYISRFKTRKVKEGTDNHDTVVIALSGDPLGVYSGNTVIEVELSKQHGFQIRRLARINSKDTVISPESETMQEGRSVWQYEVESFKALGSGAFLPSAVTYTKSTPFLKKSIVVDRHELTIHSANESIQEDQFNFQFPQNVLVIDERNGERNRVVSLWGDNNEPVTVVKGPEDLIRYDPSVKLPDPANPGRGTATKAWLLVFNFVALLGIGVYWFLRRRHGRKQ